MIGRLENAMSMQETPAASKRIDAAERAANRAEVRRKQLELDRWRGRLAARFAQLYPFEERERERRYVQIRHRLRIAEAFWRGDRFDDVLLALIEVRLAEDEAAKSLQE
ncbi:MAG: hypothetical protein ACRD36_04085 [Candidatus Acidiferrum sp.]